MPIRYDQTFYKCRCSCGEVFYVPLRRGRDSALTPPRHTAAKCPGCLQCDWLEELPDRKKRRTKPDAIAIHGVVLHNDTLDTENAVIYYQQAFRASQHQLHSVRAMVQRAVQAWQTEWNRSVLPRHFGQLERWIKEYPGAERHPGA